MQGSIEDDDWIRFTPDERQMMIDIRQYRNEKGEWPSGRKFEDWEGTSYSRSPVEYQFGSWGIAKQLAGSETDQSSSEKSYTKSDVENMIVELCEQEVEYEIDGEKKISEPGEAVPKSHWSEIGEQIETSIPSPYMVRANLNISYPEFVEQNGYEHPNPHGPAKNYSRTEIDWDAVRDELRKDITGEVQFRGFNGEIFPAGEPPSWEYINSKDRYPSRSQMKSKIGPMSEWKKELGIKRTADDVDVDPSDFGL